MEIDYCGLKLRVTEAELLRLVCRLSESTAVCAQAAGVSTVQLPPAVLPDIAKRCHDLNVAFLLELGIDQYRPLSEWPLAETNRAAGKYEESVPCVISSS